MHIFPKKLISLIPLFLIFMFYGSSPAFAQLSGTFIVDSAGNGDYNTLTEITELMNEQGINGPVNIQIRKGTYHEKILLDVPGNDHNNSITITSLSGKPGDVLLTYTKNTADTSDYVIRIVDGKKVTMSGIRFSTEGADKGRIIELEGICEDIHIADNEFTGNRNSSGIVFGAMAGGYDIFSSEKDSVAHLTIENNTFRLVSPGVNTGGSTFILNDTAVHSNIIISNNKFIDADGLSVTGIKNIEIANNEFYGEKYKVKAITLNSSTGNISIIKNRIWEALRGIYLALEAAPDKPALVANNFISVDNNEGLVLFSASNVRVAHNSISGTTDNIGFINYNSSKNLEVYNNIFYQGGQGSIYYINNSSEINSDHNSIYSESGVLLQDFSTYPPLNIRTIDSLFLEYGIDEHSVTVKPYFFSETDLHATALDLIDAGKKLPYITEDIDGEARGAQPDIGADEISDRYNLVIDDLAFELSQSSGNKKQINVQWSGRNAGDQSIEGPWQDKVYLSRDKELSDEDILLGFEDVIQGLAPGETFSRSRTYPLDIDSTGNFYVLVHMDAEEVLIEDGNDNIVASAAFDLDFTNRPDLEVTDIQAPAAINSGGEVRISWTVTNTGTVPTQEEWLDYIYLGTDSAYFQDAQRFNPDSLKIGEVVSPSGLAPGESYTSSFSFTLPLKGSGIYYFKVLADGENKIRELKYSPVENGYTGGRIAISQSPLADLEVVTVNIPTTAFSGESINISYTVKNTGNASTSKDYREDYIIISNDSTGDEDIFKNYRVRKKVTRRLELSPDSSDLVQEKVSLPYCEAGIYYVYVVSDVNNNIIELSDGNNASQAANPVEVKLKPNADFIVKNVSLSSSTFQTEQEINVSYEIHNDGFDGTHIINDLQDAIYLSALDTFNAEESVRLTRTFFADTLMMEVGSKLARTVAIQLPDSLTGRYNIYVQTDQGDKFCETPFENNNVTKYGPIDIQLAPKRDLQVEDIQVSTEGVAGTLMIIDYTVHNTAEGDTRTKNLTDSVFIVSGDGNSRRFIGLNQYNASVASGEKLSQQLNLRIPAYTEPGEYVIEIFTDAEDRVYEHQAEDNNGKNSISFTVSRDDNRLSNLAVEDVAISGEPSSGKQITVAFRVENISEATPTVSSWSDQIALLDADSNVVASLEVMRFKTLAGKSSYSQSVEFTLPNQYDGDGFIRITTDHENNVGEYYHDNNSVYAEVNIKRSPWTDLLPQSLNSESVLTAGQHTPISWTVANQGEVAALDTPWVDKLYLSTDKFLDESDVELHKSWAGEIVEVNGQYQFEDTFRLKADLKEGEYFLILNVNDRRQLYEHSDSENNVFVLNEAVTVQVPAPVDLNPQPSSIIFTGNFTTRYEVTNQGPNPAFGSWADAIYLSADEQWDKEDVLIGYETYHASEDGLEINATYQKENRDSPPFVRPGDYYVIIKADIFNYIPEIDNSNNIVASSEAFYIDMVTALTPGVVYDSLFEKTRLPYHYYSLQVPQEKGVLLNLDGKSTSSATELYYREGDIPLRGGPFDYKGDNPFQPDQRIIVPSKDHASKDYILAHASHITGQEFSYSILAETKGFSIISVSPESGGNTGIAVMDIHGFDFSDSLSVILRNKSDTLEAVHTFARSSTLARAHVNLNTLDTGKYDVVLKRLDRGDEAVLASSYMVEDTTYYDYQLDVVAPANQRIYRDFDVQVNYANNGNVNDYDVFLYVAFYQGDYQTDGFEIEYLGDGASEEIPKEYRYHPYDSTALIKDDRAYFYIGWMPVFANKARGQLNFRIKSNQLDSVHVVARFFRNPISDIHFTGNFDDLKRTRFMRDYASIFSNTFLADASGSARLMNEECITDPDVLDAMLKKGVRAHAEYVSGGIPNSPQAVAATLVQEGAKSFHDPDATNSVTESYKDLTDKRRDIVLDPTQKSAYDNLLRNLDKCLDTQDIIEDKVRKCLMKVCRKEPREDGKGYKTLCTLQYICGDPPPGGTPVFPPGGSGTKILKPTDPNDITGPAGEGAPRYMEAGSKMPYRIRFENIAEATAPAQRVLIDNPLDDDFDIRTLQLQSVGWGDTLIDLPPKAFYSGTFELGEKYNNYHLQLVAGIDLTNGKVFWTFSTIDPETGAAPADPLAGFLPPNDSTGIGEGFVTYTIKSQPGLPAGTEISNQASIVFDDEMRLATNRWINTIPGAYPATRVESLPEYMDTTQFVVKWQPDTSSVFAMAARSYRIFVAEDEEPFAEWIGNTTAQEAIFKGEKGKTYRFYSIGVDASGNQEPAPDQEDAIITLDNAVTGVHDKPEGISGIILYPNPSGDKLNLMYHLPAPSNVVIVINDIKGRKVKHLPQDFLPAGNHHLLLSDEIKGLRDGIYLIKFISSQKTTIVKWIKSE